jgi:hypothetical protein
VAVAVAVSGGVAAADLRFAAQYFFMRKPTASRCAADQPDDDRDGFGVAFLTASARASRGSFAGGVARRRDV